MTKPSLTSASKDKIPDGNIDFYNEIWTKDWQDMERLNPTARHLETMIVKIIKRLNPIDSILDIGCGIGVNIKRIQRDFPKIRILGTDLSGEILELARNYVGPNPLVEYAQLDLGKNKLEAQFDLILCSQVLEHIDDDSSALENMSRMCRRYLLLTVPGGKYNSTSRLVGHFRHYKKEELIKKVTACKFNIIYVREWGFPFHSIYKWALGKLPEEMQRKAGFGRYGIVKKGVASFLYHLFMGNLFDRGANVILLAEKSSFEANH